MPDAVPEITLRRVERDDLPAVLALYAQPSFNAGRTVALAEAERLLARMETYPDYRLYLAEEAGGVVGTIALMIVDNIAHWGRPSAVVESVVVAEDQRGRGIGRAMVAKALVLAGERGAYKAMLATGSADPAVHAFYESLGFTRHGISYCLDIKENAA